jgi:hypothetical protein
MSLSGIGPSNDCRKAVALAQFWAQALAHPLTTTSTVENAVARRAPPSRVGCSGWGSSKGPYAIKRTRARRG